MQIIDDLLPDGYANAIELEILRNGFPWAYVDDVTYGNVEGTPGLSHTLIDFENNKSSEYFPFFKPIVYSIEKASGVRINNLLRMRLGLINRVDKAESIVNHPHVDFFYPHLTACYYICDGDGDTICYEQGWSVEDGYDHQETISKINFTEAGRCTPKKNRVFVFDGRRYHSSSTPVKFNKRIVLTVNYV